MPNYKQVNDQRIQLTADEETALAAERAAEADKSGEYKLKEIKQLRNTRLQETDYMANSDYTMPDNIKTWRQSLRDIPQDYTNESKYDELLELEGTFPDITLKHSIWKKP
jgi:hypothetical protein|tara:strand:+ start:675 stop:1004 length:330 start_codon:yes stop_codon:yes gene_type:complete